jgi:hypothetical protein
MIRWLVVQTHPQLEAKAEFNLRRQGYKANLPRYLKKDLMHGILIGSHALCFLVIYSLKWM